MDDLFDQTPKDSSLFSLDVSVDVPPVTNHSPKSLPSTVEILPKLYSLAWAKDAGLLQIFFHFNIFVFAWAICIINVTDGYGFYISHFSLLGMSIIIQKLLLQVIFALLLVFYLIGQIMAYLLLAYPLSQSLQAARPRFWGDGSLSFKMSVIYPNYYCRLFLLCHLFLK